MAVEQLLLVILEFVGLKTDKISHTFLYYVVSYVKQKLVNRSTSHCYEINDVDKK